MDPKWRCSCQSPRWATFGSWRRIRGRSDLGRFAYLVMVMFFYIFENPYERVMKLLTVSEKLNSASLVVVTPNRVQQKHTHKGKAIKKWKKKKKNRESTWNLDFWESGGLISRNHFKTIPFDLHGALKHEKNHPTQSNPQDSSRQDPHRSVWLGLSQSLWAYK